MNKKILIISILAVMGVGGGVLAYTDNQSGKKEAERMAMEKKSSADLAMTKDQDAVAMTKGKEGDVMKKERRCNGYEQGKLYCLRPS